MKSFNKKIKVFIEIVPFKFLFLNNKVPQVLCGIYHTVTELAVCEPPTSFCGYEKKKSVLYSMSKKLHEDFCSLMKFLHENMYCTVCPKKKKHESSIAWREPPQQEPRSIHAQRSALSHFNEKPSTTIVAIYRWWQLTGRLESSWNTSKRNLWMLLLWVWIHT